MQLIPDGLLIFNKTQRSVSSSNKQLIDILNMENLSQKSFSSELINTLDQFYTKVEKLSSNEDSLSNNT